MPIVQFGIGDNLYSFTQTGVYLDVHSSNLGEKVSMSSRLPYLSGGFRATGVNNSPKADGNYELTGTLRSTTYEGMEAMRDALRAIERYGLSTLFYQPVNSLLAVRFTYAEAMNVRTPMEWSGHTETHQPFQISFHVPDPHWYVTNANLPEWGIAEWDDDWDNRVQLAASGTQTDTVVAQNGNMPTLAIVSIHCGVGQTCEDPTIQRLVKGAVVDEVSYTGILVADDLLVIDPLASAVTLNGNNAFTTNFDFKHPRWLSLASGNNTIRVLFANGGDAATVTFEYYDTYAGS